MKRPRPRRKDPAKLQRKKRPGRKSNHPRQGSRRKGPATLEEETVTRDSLFSPPKSARPGTDTRSPAPLPALDPAPLAAIPPGLDHQTRPRPRLICCHYAYNDNRSQDPGPGLQLGFPVSNAPTPSANPTIFLFPNPVRTDYGTRFIYHCSQNCFAEKTVILYSHSQTLLTLETIPPHSYSQTPLGYGTRTIHH